jgi:hypothetical protein
MNGLQKGVDSFDTLPYACHTTLFPDMALFAGYASAAAMLLLAR